MSDRCFLVLGGSGLVGAQIVRTVGLAESRQEKQKAGRPIERPAFLALSN